MLRARQLIGVGLLALVCSAAAGCNLFHDMQLHRLQRMNRFPPERSSEAYNWSIPDPPLPTAAPEH